MDDTARELAAAALSLTAAFVFVLGLALQQKGNLAAMLAAKEKAEGRSGPPATPLARLRDRSPVLAAVLQPAWLVGIFVGGLIGFVFLALALRIGSLSVVQPMQVTQMVFTVPLSAWVAHATMRAHEWRAALVLVAGLCLFLVGASPQSGSSTGTAAGWLVAVPLVAVLAGVCCVVAVRQQQLAAAMFGAAAGALFGLQAAAVKEMTGLLHEGMSVTGFVASWSPWLVVALTLIAVVVQNLALRAGKLASAQTTLTTTGPVVAVVVGILVFGETVRFDPLHLLAAAAGVVLCLWGISQLARSPSILAVAELTAEDRA